MTELDKILSWSGWTFMVGRILIGMAAAGATAWGVSFFVADYVVRSSAGGIQVSIQNLQTSVSDLQSLVLSTRDDMNASVRTVSVDLVSEVRRFNEQQDTFAATIVERVAQLREKDAGFASEVGNIKNAVDRIERSIDNLRFILKAGAQNGSWMQPETPRETSLDRFETDMPKPVIK